MAAGRDGLFGHPLEIGRLMSNFWGTLEDDIADMAEGDLPLFPTDVLLHRPPKVDTLSLTRSTRLVYA